MNNKENKLNYDKYGDDNERYNYSKKSSSYSTHSKYEKYENAEDDAFNVFNMFFGGTKNGHYENTTNGFNKQKQRQQQERENQRVYMEFQKRQNEEYKRYNPRSTTNSSNTTHSHSNTSSTNNSKHRNFNFDRRINYKQIFMRFLPILILIIAGFLIYMKTPVKSTLHLTFFNL